MRAQTLVTETKRPVRRMTNSGKITRGLREQIRNHAQHSRNDALTINTLQAVNKELEFYNKQLLERASLAESRVIELTTEMKLGEKDTFQEVANTRLFEISNLKGQITVLNDLVKVLLGDLRGKS